MKRLLLLIPLVVACDRGARKDLEQDDQVLNSGTAVVYLNPDKFPNISHKCDGSTGMWTTTGGDIWIVYNDRNCGGEGPITVFDNIPGSSSAQGDEHYGTDYWLLLVVGLLFIVGLAVLGLMTQ